MSMKSLVKRASLAAPLAARTSASAALCCLAACGGVVAPASRGVDAAERATGSTEQLAASAGPRVAGAPATLPPERASHVWDVKLERDAIVLEGDAARALSSWEPGGAARFDASVLTDATLVAPGRVVLVAGKALFRSKSVRTEAGALVVETEPATLADVIESGTVSWDLQLPIERPYLAAVPAGSGWRLATSAEIEGADRAEPRPYLPSWRRAGSSLSELPRAFFASGGEQKGPEFEAEVTAWPPVWKLSVKPMAYQLGVEPQPDGAMDLTVLVTQESGGKASIAYKAKGRFSNLRSRTGAYYEKGKLVRMTYEQPALRGDIEVSIAATASDDIGDFKFGFPGSMFSFAYAAGPVPIVVDVGLDITGKVTVPVSASALASTRFGFDSSLGFEWKGLGGEAKGDVGGSGFEASAKAERSGGDWLTQTGKMDRMDLAPKPADSAATIGVPVDAQFGVGFPKMSVSVFGQGLVPHFRPGAIIGSSLQWGPLCKRAYAKFQVGAGVDLKVLGHEHKLYEKLLHESEKRAAGEGCPP